MDASLQDLEKTFESLSISTKYATEQKEYLLAANEISFDNLMNSFKKLYQFVPENIKIRVRVSSEYLVVGVLIFSWKKKNCLHENGNDSTEMKKVT